MEASHSIRLGGFPIKPFDFKSLRETSMPVDNQAAGGFALVVVLLVILLIGATGAGLILVTSAETLIAANFAAAEEASYAADAASERAAGEIGRLANWDLILSGATISSFVDGPPSGTRVLADGSTINLTQIQNLSNCRKQTTCSNAEMNAVTAERPWGSNNPRWQLYSFGRLADSLAAGRIDSRFYVVVLVGDDPSETDNDPLHDGVGSSPGRGVLLVRAMAFGPRRTEHVVELTVARDGAFSAVRRISWRDLRSAP